MNITQNDKINQVQEGTIIIGIDIASELYYARAFDWRGIELGKVISFENRYEGFSRLQMWIQTLMIKHGKDKVMLGAEPTGHYWFALAGYARESEMKLVLVNPYHVKKSKELDDNHPTKSDRKDPKTIAKLVIEGRYIEPYIPEGIYADLRIATSNRYRLVKELNGLKNRIERWLKIYFPEYKDCFGSPYGKGSMVVLGNAPLPVDLLKLGVDEINQLWREQKVRAVGIKRAKALYGAAKRSVGKKDGSRMARLEIEMLLEDYKRKMEQHDKVIGIIEALCIDIPEVEKILKIKGIGLVSIAGFFAEIGDIRRFESPKQIQKLAGLAIKENSSGKHKGKTAISKRGRKRLRAILFQVILPLVASNEEFKEIHNYYTTRTQNPLKKKQSLIALCCKLIRVIFGISTKGFDYDGQKMLDDIKRPIELAAA
jgi:transposase